MPHPPYLKAPWTREQVEHLNEYQGSRRIHPYTCGTEGCREDLIPTINGWICQYCNYTQDWALDWMAKMKHSVVVSYWTEYERGWGCRPDGASYHLTMEDFKVYVKAYWDRQPKDVPYEYSKEGNPTVEDVDASLYNKIKASKNGIMLGQHDIREMRKK